MRASTRLLTSVAPARPDAMEAIERLAVEEAHLIAEARAQEPLFDQAHHGDAGFFERIAALFE